jgi:hypothetical protein
VERVRSSGEKAAAAGASQKRLCARAGGRAQQDRERRDCEREASRLHLCSKTNHMGQRCMYTTRVAGDLGRHVGKGKHQFRGGESTNDALLRLVSDPITEANATMLRVAAGTRPNIGKAARALASATRPAPPSGAERRVIEKRTKAFRCGRWSKRPRKEPYYKPPDLLAALEELWEQGETSGKKIKPDVAWVRHACHALRAWSVVARLCA